MVLILLLLAAAPLWAADDAVAILNRLVEAQKSNDVRARQYTFLEETDRFTYEKDGRLRKDRSETTENLFIEGLEYKRLIARNGKPLPPREQARVEREMRQTAEERRKHHPPSAPGGRISFGAQKVDLGSLSELLSLFDNRLVGEEEIRGRKTWVIESTPKPAPDSTTEHDRQVLAFRKKLWIDKADHVMAREVVAVLSDTIFPKPGSTLTFDYDKVNSDTWHPTSIILDVYRIRGKVFRPWGRTEYRLSNFRKFDVQSTITVPQ